MTADPKQPPSPVGLPTGEVSPEIAVATSGPGPGLELGLLGDYRILRLIGEGGMAWVYEAEHIRLGRPVALKRLKPPFGQQRPSVQAFFEEARAANQIPHPSIVQVTDFAFDADGAYLVMELLAGGTLTARLRESGALVPPRALDIAFQAADALAAAHRAGIVHRDINPSNLFLVDDAHRRDRVKLLDFGIAQLEESVLDVGVTAPRERTIGTPAYMSPEQAEGRSVDGRSDVYSLGVVLHELLAGSRPFDGTTRMALVYQHTSAAPAPLPGEVNGHPLPWGCAEIVQRCLKKRPADRYADAGALRDALAATGAAAGIRLGLEQAPEATPRRASSSSRRSRWPGLVAVILFSLVAASLALPWLIPDASDGDGGAEEGSHPAPASSPSRDGPRAAHSRRGPRKVTLHLAATPIGAKIERLAPDARVLGLAPLRLTLSADSRTWRLRLTADGYRPRELTVRPDRDRDLRVKLEPRPRPKTPPLATGRRAEPRRARARRRGSRRTRLRPRTRRPRRSRRPRRAPPRRRSRNDLGTVNPFE
jgi:serine/threonine-protein kinase